MQICLPAGSGYTLRRYRDDVENTDPVFLGLGGVVHAYASTAGLVAFLRGGEPHDLAALPDWDPPDWDEVGLVADIGLTYPMEPYMDVCRLDVISGALRDPATALDLDGEEYAYDVAAILAYPRHVLLETYQVAAELAAYAGLTDVVRTLDPSSPLGGFGRDMSHFHYTKRKDRGFLDRYDLSELADAWAEVTARIASVVEFRG